VVIEALREADDIMCRCALGALTDFGSAAVPALNEALRDADAILRGRAAVVLSKIGLVPADVIRALIEALRDVHEDVRLGAIMALLRVGQAAVDAALRDADHEVSERAVAALKEVGIKTDRNDKLPSDGWLIWENETHVIIEEGVGMKLKVYGKRPGKFWDDRWHKDFFMWTFDYNVDGTPICVGRRMCSPD
jgi:antitoxin component of RelBE/YafQ-DinJ toxin-antitoxin module